MRPTLALGIAALMLGENAIADSLPIHGSLASRASRIARAESASEEKGAARRQETPQIVTVNGDLPFTISGDGVIVDGQVVQQEDGYADVKTLGGGLGEGGPYVVVGQARGGQARYGNAGPYMVVGH